MSGSGGWLPPSEAGERYVPPTAATSVEPAPPAAVSGLAASGVAGTGVPGPGELADFWARAAAALLDGLIRTGVLVVALLVGAIGFVAGETAGIVGMVVFGIAAFVLVLLYAPWMMVRTNGQTVGHRVSGTRVVRLNGQSWDWGSALTRELAIKYLLFELGGSLFTLYIATLLNYLWPLWDDRNQALHDKLANTVVVRE